MVTALYLRVSTQDQSTSMQREELLSMCSARKWDNIKEYDDTASGAKRERPALDLLIGDVKVGRVKRVVVWRFDRLARGTLHLLELLDLFNLYGVEFISMKESLDTSLPLGRAVMTILGAVADLERHSIRSRVKAGIANAQKNGTKTGNRIGRPRAVFDRRLAEEMQRNGVSIRAIAENLKVSQTIVWRELKKC